MDEIKVIESRRDSVAIVGGGTKSAGIPVTDANLLVPGAPGVSCTHSWEGTVLSVTSASGTSSADLKGSDGKDGYTPVNGVDYFTEEDKAELVEEVLASLPVYNGEYEVTPSTVGDKTFFTASKYMDADLKVLKIPYAEVTNNSGGSTVTIGEEV